MAGEMPGSDDQGPCALRNGNSLEASGYMGRAARQGVRMAARDPGRS